MQTLITLLRLSLLPQFGATKIEQLLEQISLADLLAYDQTQLRHIGWTTTQINAWFSPNQRLIDELLAWQQQQHHQMITLLDAQYPLLLRQTNAAPPILFVKGNINALSAPQIAVVGSRYCSPYGEHCAKTITSELAQAGLTITSGLALGIDGICHQAALLNQGKSVAVLGCGLNTIYPARHQKLAQHILDTDGALVSELIPDTPPIPENFPRRNRIISGLSFGTLVIEASSKSGSLITARYALEQNREVFAVPGALDNPLSQGCHHLIKQGAWLVESGQDILEILAPQIAAVTPLIPSENTTISIKTTTKPTAPTTVIKPDIPPEHQALYQQLNTATPISPDELAIALQCPIEQLLTDLLELEMLGVIQQIRGGYVRCY
ncbi:DNA-processing protein DprA [Gallibacterium salpingitidis]|uniref:DNA-processing protein DprA n=1 Tax=Gallibacterium salpingitidis TaxID=505341 RepID=UPI00266ED397|nr:DNA-processing protein DprA [Gallibacterium salpingitidis]WKS99429.1 DNA-processing protein DprA [Gallibacterium salpingitidis]